MAESDRSVDSPIQYGENTGHGIQYGATFQDGDEDPLIVSDDPYVQDTLRDSRDPNYAPQDKYNIAFILMIILGMGTAYPWSFFVTATDYFQYSFRNVTFPDHKTHYQTLFETSLAVIATTCGFLGLSLSTILSRYVVFTFRVSVGYAVILAVFCVTTALAMRNTDSWQGGFFALTMTSVFLINLANSMVCGGLFGMQACLPSRFTTALMIGQPLAGLVVVFADILSILGGDGSPNAVRKEATGYFGSAVAATVLCIFAFAYFQRLPVVKYYLDAEKKDSGQIENIDRSLGSSESTTTVATVKEAFPTKLVLKRTWKISVALFLNFFVTMAVFPAIATAVLSLNADSHALITNQLFLPIACFVVLNVGDLTGRWAHGFAQFPAPEQSTLTLLFSFLRLGLIPAFMLCNAHPRRHLPVVFGDAVFVFLVTVMAFSNGYLGNLGMMYGPKLVPASAAETTGTLMGLFLNAGLWLGSVFSFPLVYFL